MDLGAEAVACFTILKFLVFAYLKKTYNFQALDHPLNCLCGSNFSKQFNSKNPNNNVNCVCALFISKTPIFLFFFCVYVKRIVYIFNTDILFQRFM